MTEQGPAQARVEVWQQPNGQWRWRYVEQDGEERVELPSNEPDPTCDEAVHKAAIAYPGLTIVISEPPGDDPGEVHGPSGRHRRRGGRRVVLLLIAGVVVVVLLARRVQRLSRPPR